MTGYATASVVVGDRLIRAECRSVNHRGLDLRVFAPPALRWVEPRAMELARETLDRGRVELRLEVEAAPRDGVPGFDEINGERFVAVVDRLRELTESTALRSPRLAEVLTFRDYFTGEEARLADLDEESVDGLLKEVIQGLQESRSREGAGLTEDLAQHLADYRARLIGISDLVTQASEGLKARVRKRLADVSAELEAGEVDPQRVAQELAFLIDRGDISEELQRATAHTANLAALLEEPDEGAQGKKIDFILQELIRETNTMGSKSQFAELTTEVIEMKSLIEKMREQAANVE